MDFSRTTNPEPGLKQKVRGLLAYKLKGKYRVTEIIAIIDNGQTLPYDGIISRVAWETMQQPELDPDLGTVGTAAEGASLNKRGIVAK